MDQRGKEIADRLQQFHNEGNYQELNNLLTDELLTAEESALLYGWKAIACSQINQLSLCKSYADTAIDIDAHLSLGYVARGAYFKAQKDFPKAIDDYSIAIQLYGDDGHLYARRAILYFWQKDYANAINDLNKVIAMDPNTADNYNVRGLINDKLQNSDKALADFNAAIQLDMDNAASYYSRALHYKEAGLYEEAISDYKMYVKLMRSKKSFFVNNAISEIQHLEKKLEKWFDEIDIIVEDIKRLLLFENEFVAHYTSLSSTKAMIFDNSPLRLSEGTFLNDTSEGAELFEYLAFSVSASSNKKVEELIFTEKPFIGSFVDQNKHNDLALWRMYGKEERVEAKGCVITISREKLIDNLVAHLKLLDDELKQDFFPNESSFMFYRVAYKNSNNRFIIAGLGNEDGNSQLNENLEKLKNKLGALNREQKIDVATILNDIIYLFKGNEYQYEHEVRLVLSGVGFKKHVVKNDTPPKVYVELVDVVPTLKRITIGPKVERAEEWAAAFNYHIKEKNKEVEVVISRLPFK